MATTMDAFYAGVLSVLLDLILVAVVMRLWKTWRERIKGNGFAPLANVQTLWCRGVPRCTDSNTFVRRVCVRAPPRLCGCLVILGGLVADSQASLVGGIDTAADREVLTDRCAQLVRLKLDIQLPALPGQVERRALAAGEEYAAQRRYRESLAQYLKARALAPHPVLHFLIGVSCVKLGMYRHAEAALRKVISVLDSTPNSDAAAQRLRAASLVVLGNLALQTANRADKDVLAALMHVSKSDALQPKQRSFVLSGLALVLSADSGRVKQAEEPALESHKLDETNAIALHVLGLIYMKRFIYARAREWLKRAAALDDHPMNHKLLVRCVWVQFEGYEGVRDKDKSVQGHLELASSYKDSPIVSMALVMAYANSKKYSSALKESSRSLELFLSSNNEHLLWDPHDPLVVELLAVRLVCLLLHSSYSQAVREMLLYTDMNHPVTAATASVLGVCLSIVLGLTLVFGWEGCIISSFGLVLLILRGVLTMLLLSAISSTYQSLQHEPFPIPNALSFV